MCLPCALTYQLWHLLSAKEKLPKMPIWSDLLILEGPCVSQEGGSMLLRRGGGFLRRGGGFLRRSALGWHSGILSGPVLQDIAIVSLRYPLPRDIFSAIQASPQRVRYLPLVPCFTQTYHCDIPFCNISRDTCAIPQENKHKRVLRYYRWK